MMKYLNMKRYISYILVLVLLTLSLVGCGKQEEKIKEEEPEEDRGPVIGMSFDSFLIERWERDRDVFVAAAKEAGVEVNVQNANGDIDTQIEQIKYFIEKKVDAIVVVAIDGDKLSDVISDAKQKGIIVVAYDRMIRNADVDLYVSFDNHRVGELMGESLVQSDLSKKRVLMLSGPTEDDNVNQVNSGFTEVCEKNGFEIADIFYTAGWRPENAADYLKGNSEILEDVDAIMCGNDSIATQAIRFLAEKRMAGNILVTGQDAELEACQRIVQGTQLMTVYKPVEKQAKAAAEATIELIRGEEVKGINSTTSNGVNDIPSIILDPIAVNRDNMDRIIVNSGFHMKEDVYLFVPTAD